MWFCICFLFRFTRVASYVNLFKNIMFQSTELKTSSAKKSRLKGFTFVELILVSALMMLLLGLSVPFVTSLRSELAMKETLRQVKTDVITGMGYALAGKSIAALSSGDLTNSNLIPSHYALFFEKDNTYGDPAPYYYVELSTELVNRNQYNTKTIYSIAKEMPSEVVFLKDIRLKKTETDIGVSVTSSTIFFSAPFANVNFIAGQPAIVENPGYTFNSLDVFSNDDYRFIDLVFQFKDESETQTTLTFGVDKVINIS